ncbi:hypothetical protein SASPL_152230 [Salvia splendens]|uniref:Steroid nuclear receptor ligand-binding n=1 Tax=Salvia splendens TaxID=180675 RepID=A0A8X8W2Z7_SALSN|nr:hypothetical protein SASPL_152230 [Salvia splendens]
MEVPIGFVAKCWSFVSFLPFFFSLFILSFLKGLIICPIAVTIIAVGNSAVAIGLWLAHFLWTYYCVANIIGGVGYGFFAPLIATFEAVGANVTDKAYHCFIDGCFSTIESSCTIVRDFTDFCFHSYFSYMDELSKDVNEDEKPIDIELWRVPGCLLVSSIAVLVDVPLITAVALWKSPYMLFRGWKRLLEDLVGREGPFLETMCIPFAGLAILLWPLAVLGAFMAALFSSFFLGLYAGVVVHQEESLQMGLAYIVAVISLFDEYGNDLLSLSEGSCFPRPQYRRRMKPSTGLEKGRSLDSQDEREGSCSRSSKLVSEGSRTLNKLFNGDCKKLGIELPSWCILQCLLTSAKSESSGLIISEEMELTRFNLPRDKVFEWFIGPLFTMKEQIKGLQLQEDEESCLRKLVLACNNDRPENWDNTEFPSTDKVRRAQLQAVIRRLQGIVGSMSRLPTFRRRFRNLVKVLYVEAIQTGIPAKHPNGSSRIRLFIRGGRRDRNGAQDDMV